jgi:hypothetical protein
MILRRFGERWALDPLSLEHRSSSNRSTDIVNNSQQRFSGRGNQPKQALQHPKAAQIGHALLFAPAAYHAADAQAVSARSAAFEHVVAARRASFMNE